MLPQPRSLIAVLVCLVAAGCQREQELDPPAGPPTRPAPIALLEWGNTWAEVGDWDQAISGYTETIQMYPTFEPAYLARGGAWEQKGDWERAIADYTEAIRLCPESIIGPNRRRLAWSRAGEWDKVIDEHSEQISRQPDDKRAWNNRAWVLATCPVARFRDGARALVDAQKAVELSQGKDPMILDTLAAALAEAGDFERAVEAQKKALSLTKGASKLLGKDGPVRLKLYEQKKTYQEAVPPLGAQQKHVLALNSVSH